MIKEIVGWIKQSEPTPKISGCVQTYRDCMGRREARKKSDNSGQRPLNPEEGDNLYNWMGRMRRITMLPTLLVAIMVSTLVWAGGPADPNKELDCYAFAMRNQMSQYTHDYLLKKYACPNCFVHEDSFRARYQFGIDKACGIFNTGLRRGLNPAMYAEAYFFVVIDYSATDVYEAARAYGYLSMLKYILGRDPDPNKVDPYMYNLVRDDVMFRLKTTHPTRPHYTRPGSRTR